MRILLEETAGASGLDFFQGLARGVARVAGARYGMVGELLPGGTAVATRAVWSEGRFLPDFTYELAGTPCDLALHGGPCLHTRDVARRFPEDAMLREMGIEAYLGIEVHTADGAPAGILVALHDEPLQTIGSFDALLRLFALQAASEIERGRSEAALRRSELRYRSLVSGSPDAICVLDPGTHAILEVNDRFRRMTGFPAEETLGLHICSLLTGDGGPDLPCGPGEGSAPAAGPHEMTLRRREGPPLDVEVSVSAVEVGGDQALMATIRDISERRAAQAAILRLSDLHELILRSAAEGIVGLDRRGVHTFVNPAAAEMLGWTPAELVGRPSHSTWHHTTASGAAFPAENCPVLSSLRDGEVRRVARDLFRRKDGSGFFVEYVASPIYEAGQQTGTVVVFRDISKEARLESVAEAVETMNSVGYVFSAVRHELGNPVNSVKMALSVLRENLGRFGPESVRDYVDRSLSELYRVEELLASLRNFGLYDDVTRTAVDVEEFVRRFLDLFGRDYEARGIGIRYVRAPERLVAEADPRALRQILLNLFANAVEALEGRPTPEITIRAEAEGEEIRLTVADNGCGMGASELADAFRPFRTTKANGTGLGLVIARRLLSRFGGTIGIASRPGEGTEVVVSLRRSAS